MRLVLLDVLSWLALRLRPSPRGADATKSRPVERAQRALIDAMPSPMIVISLPEHALLYANCAARPWLAGVHGGPLRTVLPDPAVRERFLALAGRAGGVDDFPLRWAAARGIQRTLASARPFDFLGRAALLTTLTPVGPVEAFGAPPSACDDSAASAFPLLSAPVLPAPSSADAATAATDRKSTRLNSSHW